MDLILVRLIFVIVVAITCYLIRPFGAHQTLNSGIERLMMALVPTDNIRDVMAFPKTASATDLMIDAPGEVDPKQLEELHLRIAEDDHEG